jgi:hypothetical protein
VKIRLLQLLFGFVRSMLYADTRPTRFSIALVNIAMLSYLQAPTSQDDFALLDKVFPFVDAIWTLDILLVVNAVALLAGLSGKFNLPMLFLEGVLAFFIWTTIAMIGIVSQNGWPGPASAVLLLVMWVCARYPTHWGVRND